MGGSERADRKALLLSLVVTILLCCFYGNIEATNCIENEKHALLTFKQDLTSNRLSSWIDGVDCCEWFGVVCNNITGHVTELNLKNLVPFPNLTYSTYSKFGGSLNPSLLHLQQLQVLDLALNNFSGIRIPSFIGSIHSLRHLNLSYAGFHGLIPHQLGNLSNLRSLSVASNYYLKVDNIQWLAGLSNLQSLDLTSVNLSEASNWLQVINMIPSLTELYLSGCSLSQIPHTINLNLSSLTILVLSWNEFSSSVPRWIFDLKKLVSLDLTSNSFSGPLPEGLWNLTSLKHLDMAQNGLNGKLPKELFNLSSLVELHLYENELSGRIPDTIGKLCNMNVLSLSENQLEGTIPDTIGKLCNMNLLYLSENKLEGLISDVIHDMAGCFSNAIQYIYLEKNHFSGQLTDKVGQFKNLIELYLDFNSISGPIPANVGLLSSLEKLYLGFNSISGPIPTNVGLLSSLEELSLRDNKLNGTLPHSFGQLSKLVYLHIAHNRMEGIVAQSLLENLTSLWYLYASGNSMTLEVDQNWVPPTQYEALGLGSWKLGPQFPNWIQSQKKIRYLDLSFAGISGAIPSWIWSLSTELLYLNLSHNHFQGEISIVCCISQVDLSSNQISGQLPHIVFWGMSHLDLSNNSFSGVLTRFLCNQVNETQRIGFLNLGKNLLSGEIPDCWMNWPSIKAINLANNNLIGNIPRSIGHLKWLRSLHLRNNSLSGGIPSSLKNCTSLQAIDLAENKLTGNIPIWLGLSFMDLRFLILRSNRFQGELAPELCHLTSLRILDVANNNFSGFIPKCVKNFTYMVREKLDYVAMEMATNFTESVHLATKGNEYDFDFILQFVTTIDLSHNNFFGKIPDELTFLLQLKSLNLSGNQLGGMIPMYIGKMVQLESLDLSRNRLSGSIPSSISQLSFLSFLNLSYNNLSGRIPLSSQLQSFNASCFIGNHLYGCPLTDCDSTNNNDGGVNEIEEDDAEVVFDTLFYIFMGSGFVVGFWGVCFTLILKKSWRYGYFRFIDEVWFEIYYLSTKYILKR